MDIHIKASQLLNLTQAMLAAATADDWDEFGLLEPQRRALLEMVFSNQSLEESAQLRLADVVIAIQQIDQTITRLIIQQRDLAAEELRHLRHASAASKAYRIAIDDPS